MNKIKIPKILQELHGEESNLISLISTYLIGIVVTICLYFLLRESQIDLPLWKEILFLLMSFDIGGGVIANFTEGTRKYYRDQLKKHTSFILLHILHGVAFIIIFNDLWLFFSFMTIFSILSCLFLVTIKDKESKRIVSALLFTVGVLIVFLIPCSIEFLRLVPVLFFTKLILGFSGE